MTKVAPAGAAARAAVMVEYGEAALPSGASIAQVTATWMALSETSG